MERRKELVNKFYLHSRLPETAQRILALHADEIERGLKELELYMVSATEVIEDCRYVHTDGVYGGSSAIEYGLLLSEHYTLGRKTPFLSVPVDGRGAARKLIEHIRTQIRLRKELNAN